MDDYINIGKWFGGISGLIAWIGSLFYAISEYGWFIGTPIGFLVGLAATLLWPLIAIGIVLLIYGWNS